VCLPEPAKPLGATAREGGHEVSGVMATTASGTSSGGAAVPRNWGTPAVRAAIIGTGAVGLALRLWILCSRGLMSITQFDDGPYFGSAVRLVHGVLPYRDYAFVQPPGITELMSPAALDSYLGGTAWALVIGRLLTVCAGAATVVLAGFLVRHRGALAVLLAGGIMAIYPAGAASARTVLLEPWLVLFCLAGAVAIFDGDRVTASTRRLAWGGVAFGFAGAIKVWAIVPVLVIAVLCLPQVKRAAVFAGGVAAGFLIPVLPFAIAAPARFYDDVVVAQLARISSRIAAWKRLNSMLGLPNKVLSPGAVITLAIALVVFVIVAQIAASRVTRRPPAPLDWFALVSAALIVAMLLWPPYYAAHYAAFLGPFLALCLALPVARLATGIAERRQAGAATAGQAAQEAQATPGQPARRQATPWLARAGLIVAGLAVLAAAVAQAPPPTRMTARPGLPAVSLRVIPKGACVITDSAVYLLIANRFTSDVPGCPQMVGSLAIDLTLGGGRRPSSGAGQIPAVTAAWHQAFSAAQWVLLTPESFLRIPWNNAALQAYFHSQFRLVRHANTYSLYARTGIQRASRKPHTSG
jgi:dolichyl-phosphate-mannose-protein mannosyltransferase